MKALSLTQPWASLVALSAKKIETRSWRTNYTGPLAIHASKTYPNWAREMTLVEPFRSVLSASGIGTLGDIPCGKVICTVKLLGCRHTEDVVNQITDQERKFGDYGEERWAWFLELVEVFKEPIPARGAQGLWWWEH